ncbi:phosphoenolpyruvate--protein phosphotransferase [Candidatus Bathyarchaeota archaeon]|nr:phosphoenolpyruvate--protein phosphotransferase [Candidatus Bathyarchaeota archaeon]
MLKGVSASPNIAIGKAFVYEKELKFKRRTIDEKEVETELKRLDDVIEKSKKELDKLRDEAVKKIGDKEAKIFEAHMLMLQDPALITEAKNKIRSRVNAEAAVDEVVKKFIAMFERMEDQYMKERAIDVQDVGERLIKNLLGQEFKSLADLDKRTIVIADSLTPSDTINIDKSKVIGFATNMGGVTSHVAIIAREYGIPAVVGLGDVTKKVKTGDLVIVDGGCGTVIIKPDQETINRYKDQMLELEHRRKELEKLKDLPAETFDGVRIEIAANLGSPDEVANALANGAEGVGLLRTEFLYQGRRSLPTEEEQFEAYKTIARKMGERPVIVRTLDIGGDKPPSYLDMPKELNPFLGWRAIRISLDRTDIFKTQLRAILRASQYGNLKIMFPMISSVEEVRKSKKILEDVKKELKNEKVPFKENVEIGIMVEVPSAAVIADAFAREVDFFSIGTNDLTQYTLAVDRTNERVTYLFNELHPAVLHLIKNVIDAAHSKGIWTGMCGEMAGKPIATPILLGLGLDEFSMSSMSIPEVKKIIRSIKISDARELAKEALNAATTNDVYKLSRKFLTKIK